MDYTPTPDLPPDRPRSTSLKGADLRLSPPPLSESLAVNDGEAIDDIWQEEFLALGGRLRFVYGSQVALDEGLKAYVVSYSGDIKVRVTCSDELPRAESVRFACPIITIAREAAGLWQFALRENARLRLARLSYDQGVLWVDYEIPVDFAVGRPLQIAVAAVGSAARTLTAELTSFSAEAA